MSNKLKEFRCTRNKPYDAPGCAGNEYFTGRQGHYVFAETPMGAALEMFASWPDEMLFGFTMQEKGTDRIFSWNARDGLALYRFDDSGEEKPRLAARCEEEPRHPTLDLPSIIRRGADLYEADEKSREVVDGFRAQRQRLEREAEQHASKESAKRRQKEREEMEAAARGPTIEVSGTVHVDVSFVKAVVVDVPVNLLAEYRKNVQAGPNDDALNQMSDLFEQAAMKNSLEQIDGVDGWGLIEYTNVIPEWKDPQKKEE